MLPKVDKYQTILHLTHVPYLTRRVWSDEVLSHAAYMKHDAPVVFFLSHGSLCQAITTLHKMTKSFCSFFSEVTICIIDVDAIDNCALLKQIHLVEHLTKEVLRKYRAAPSFRAGLLSSLTELEFTSATLNRVFQDPYLAQHILEFAYVLPKQNLEGERLYGAYYRDVHCNITIENCDIFHRHLESTFLPCLSKYYDGVKRAILANYPKPAQIERNIRDKAIKTTSTARTLERQSIAQRGDRLSRQQFKLSKRYHDDCRAMRTKQNNKIFSKQPLARRGNKKTKGTTRLG
jgi:hypothetical protein